jgi:hypothetical protein
MVTIQLSEDLAKHLQDIARRENHSIDEVVESIVRDRVSEQPPEEIESGEDALSALDALMGMFDDDVTDMSKNVKENLREYDRNKYGRSD